MRIRVHIDRVILDGLPATMPSRRALEPAIAAHLRSILTESAVSWPTRGRTVDRVLAPDIAVPARRSRDLGPRIAGSVGRAVIEVLAR